MIFSLSFVTLRLIVRRWLSGVTSELHQLPCQSPHLSIPQRVEFTEPQPQRLDDRYKLRVAAWERRTVLRKTELDRECARLGATVQLMKSSETKLTAYGRWRCRTSVDNDVILTSALVVRPGWSSRLAIVVILWRWPA